jgi:hypothetical protein
VDLERHRLTRQALEIVIARREQPIGEVYPQPPTPLNTVAAIVA